MENLLLNNESIIFETHHHWTNFFKFHTIWSLGIVPLVQMKLERYVLTNQRVVLKKGILFMKTIEMSLNQIESVTMHQSIFEKLLGYGKVTLVGTGGAKYYLDGIAKPLEFKKRLQEAKQGKLEKNA